MTFGVASVNSSKRFFAQIITISGWHRYSSNSPTLLECPIYAFICNNGLSALNQLVSKTSKRKAHRTCTGHGNGAPFFKWMLGLCKGTQAKR
jgi:hypothetical protein